MAQDGFLLEIKAHLMLLSILSLQAVALELLAVAVLVVIARLFLAKALVAERLRNLHCLLLLERLIPLLLVQVVRVLAVLLGRAQTVPVLFSAQLPQQVVVVAEVQQILQVPAVAPAVVAVHLLVEQISPVVLEPLVRVTLVALVELFKAQMKMAQLVAAVLVQ
jgi:hypothetical protein